MTKILKVVSCGAVQQVTSQKAEGGTIAKRSMLLQELGGKYENQYVATQLGAGCTTPLHPGDIVAAALRFMIHDYNGQVYQDIVVEEVAPLNS